MAITSSGFLKNIQFYLSVFHGFRTCSQSDQKSVDDVIERLNKMFLGIIQLGSRSRYSGMVHSLA